MWLLSVCRWRKCVPQISQGYGFSPVWMSTWARKWATWWESKSQCSKISGVGLDELEPNSIFFCNSSNLHKSGAARLTLVRLLPRVDACVRLEVGRPVKLGAADVAVVGFRTWSRRQQLAYAHAKVRILSVNIYLYIIYVSATIIVSHMFTLLIVKTNVVSRFVFSSVQKIALNNDTKAEVDLKWQPLI